MMWASSRLRSRFGVSASGPELLEVRRHRDQPLVDSLVEDDLIALPGALALLAGIGQNAKLLVPFRFERVGDKAIVGVDEHEATLGEIGVRMRALDRAAAQPICLVMPCLDLFAHFERQFDGRRRHLLGNQLADGFIDGRAGDRLAQGFAAIGMGAIANIPGFLPAAPGGVANPKMPAALTAHSPSLQQRRAFSRDRRSRRVIAVAVRFERLEIVLILLPS